MKIAVVGGGITGLTAAYTLTKRGHDVTLFESGPALGGLAGGFRKPDWNWFLEYSYHHLFTNDTAIVTLIKELGLEKKLIVRRPVTASLYQGKPYQLDSPIHLLRFPGLSGIDKARTTALLAFLKINPLWKPLENITAEELLISLGGKHAYTVLWEPLLVGKFGTLASTVSAAWFWARIKKRTPNLYYIEGGFHTLITALEKAIQKHGGTIKLNKKISGLKNVHGFDKTLFTGPTPNSTIPHLWAQTLMLETEKPILKNIYWLNITDRSYPFLAAIAHTNFMDAAHYGGRHLTYFGNYLPPGHPYLSMDKKQLLKKFLPFIEKISENRLQITHSFLFTAPYAQPVHQKQYSQKIPPITSTAPGLYHANMDYIVPWDRGTNYAVELGIKAARIMLHHEK